VTRSHASLRGSVAGLKDVSTVWNNIKEIDLKPIREAATNPPRIVLVGAPESGRHTLAEQMRTDPARPGIHTQSTLVLISTEAASEAPSAHLIIILVDATRNDFSAEQALVKTWSEAGKNVLVLVNKIDLLESNTDGKVGPGWQAARVIHGSVNDITYLQQEFVPTVLELLPQLHLALGRYFPLFRLPVARQLINETCLSNAGYSFSTGLAEIVPVLDIPLNLTDMVVLTKTQAFLAYKLGLLLGFSTRWQDYITEFGSVIGTGFLWRQIARQLIGLVPAWGIVPKVAVAYAGTYVVGNAILGWYLTGKNLSPKQMRALYAQAFMRGKEYARRLSDRIPRPKLGKGNKARLAGKKTKPELLQGETVIIKTTPPPIQGNMTVAAVAQPGEAPGNGAGAPTIREGSGRGREKKTGAPRKFQLGWRRKEEKASVLATRVCPECGKSSSADASFCQYCGMKLEG
jgi:uncharacterized protein (DUF697 family)